MMKRMVLVSEVAGLSRVLVPKSASELFSLSDSGASDWRKQNISELMTAEDASIRSGGQVPDNSIDIPDINGVQKDFDKTEKMRTAADPAEPADEAATPHVPPSVPRSIGGRSEYAQSEKQLIMDHLERWEEPERVGEGMVRLLLAILSIGCHHASATITACECAFSHTDMSYMFPQKNNKVTLGAVLQFRRALTLLKRHYPFR